MSICILRLKNPNSHKFCHQSTHLRESRTPAVTGGRRAADLFHGSVLFVPDHSVLVLAPQRFIAVNQPLGLLLFRHSLIFVPNREYAVFIPHAFQYNRNTAGQATIIGDCFFFYVPV